MIDRQGIKELRQEAAELRSNMAKDLDSPTFDADAVELANIENKISTANDALLDARTGSSYEAADEGSALKRQMDHGVPLGAKDLGKALRHGTDSRKYADEEALEGLAWYIRASAMGDQSIIPEHFRTLSTSGSAGGYTVPAPLVASIVELAAAESVALQAGVRVVNMSSNTESIAKVATRPSGQWRAENAEITAEDVTFEAQTLTATSLATLVKASRELVQDSITDIGSLVASEVATTFATAIDKGILSDDGTSDTMVGLREETDIAAAATGAIGSPTWDDVIDIVSDVRANNHEAKSLIMFERDAVTLAKLKVASEANHYATRPGGYLDGVNILATNNLALETADSYWIAGDFSHSVFGSRLDFWNLTLDQRYAEFNQVGWVFVSRCDHVVTDDTAFQLYTGVTA